MTNTAPVATHPAFPVPGAIVVPPAPLEPPAGTPYQHLFREPGRRWWRPLVSLAVFLGSYLVMALALLVVVGIALIPVVMDQPMTEGALDLDLVALFQGWSGVGLNLAVNLLLAALIPAVLLANRVAHRIPSGYTHSVAGRFRWGWAATVVAVLVPVWAVYLAIGFVLEPVALGVHRDSLAVTGALLAVVLLTTPLQSAGEEYFFRGWLLQNIGVGIARPVVALVVPTAISAAIFGLAHGSLDPWILVSLGATSVAACYLTWRTGGLEAAVALHSVNNVLIMGFLILSGTSLGSAMIDTTSTSTWLAAGLAIVFHGLAVLAVEWVARRRGITATR